MLVSRFDYRIFSLIILLSFALMLGGPSPIRAQSPEKLLIESDEPRVIQSGSWSNQEADAASGDHYLFSSGAEADGLALAFMGSAIEILYVTGPQFGTLAIEVDGTVLRTVITTADKIAYGQVAKIDYLSDEPHTLKVYAQAGGIIALDAFQITPIVAVGEVSGANDTLATNDSGPQNPAVCSPVSIIHAVSKSSIGEFGNNHSGYVNLSADGRYVVFNSDATNLVLGDTNASQDVFVYDRQTCTLDRVSVSSTGGQGGASSIGIAISGDGHYIAFSSNASNLVTGDTNGASDVFVHDRRTKTTLLASVGLGGVLANHNSYNARISADGRFITFQSSASNLVANDTNGLQDIFVYDRQAGATTRVSVASGGGQVLNGDSYAYGISADGRYMTFTSAATNLVPNDTNNVVDAFLHDRQTNSTTRVSVASGGGQANNGTFNLAVSADGRFVVFASSATNLASNDTNNASDVFLHDRQANTTTRVSIISGGGQANSGSSNPSISANGRYITFISEASNLVPNDTNGRQDAFVYDRVTNTTTRVSAPSNGGQANHNTNDVAVSVDGRYIAFSSRASNLVAGDTGDLEDIFVTPTLPPAADTLALFNPTFQFAVLLNTLADNPPPAAYNIFSAYAPVTGGQWLMGDWNGDGLKTAGVYLNGAFFYTNKPNGLAAGDWASLWIGISGPPIAGRFNGTRANDCIGAVQSAQFPPHGTAFAFYFTCDLSGDLTPILSSQFLGVILPDSGGFTGTHQFGAGDFDGDGIDSIAVRRGMYAAFGNIPPTTNTASMSFAQFLGAPFGPDAGTFVVGNWDNDPFDSFGLFYQSGEFFYRNDLLFNSGAYGNQSVGQPITGTVQVSAWR